MQRIPSAPASSPVHGISSRQTPGEIAGETPVLISATPLVAAAPGETPPLA